jgi:hypothetical protein
MFSSSRHCGGSLVGRSLVLFENLMVFFDLANCLFLQEHQKAPAIEKKVSGK